MSTLRLLHRLIREVLADPLPLAGAVVALVGLSGGQLGLPWLIQRWVEGPLIAGGPLAPWLGAASFLVATVAVSLLLSWLLLARVNQGLLARLRHQAVVRLLGAEPETLRPFATGDLMSRVLQDAGLLSGFAELLLRRVIGDGLLALGAVVMMFVLDPLLAAAACLLAPAIGLLLTRVGGVIRRLGGLTQRRMGGLSARLQEQLSGFTTVKGYAAESFEADRFSRENHAYRHAAVAAEGWMAALVATVFLVAASGFVGAIALGSHRVADATLSPGGLLAFCLYAGLTIEPLRRLAEVHGLLQRSLAAAERVFEVVELPVDGPRDGFVPAPRGSRGAGAVTFAGVHFAYDSTAPVLAGLDLAIRPREQLAVVGASGAGKSTLAALLVRFVEPRSGRVQLDDLELHDLPRAELRRRVRLVEQRPFLFSGSLRDNVRYGSWDAPPETVAEALRMVGMDDWLRSDPRGLDASLGEGGRSLSGGQRQRVALARAILSDPEVLILDEATSALDSDGEARLMTELEDWLARRTVLVIAHRLSTVMRMPRLVLLEGGRLVADGSFADLQASCASFRTLLADQLVDGRSTPGAA